VSLKITAYLIYREQCSPVLHSSNRTKYSVVTSKKLFNN